MSDNNEGIGTISWFDLTVQNAEVIRNFYTGVVGWHFEFVSMGDYCDYSMLQPQTKMPIAGICHARGVNSNLPSQWLPYITINDIDKSVSECEKLGGKILTPIKSYSGMGRYCVIQDPAGAVCALFESKSDK